MDGLRLRLWPYPLTRPPLPRAAPCQPRPHPCAPCPLTCRPCLSVRRRPLCLLHATMPSQAAKSPGRLLDTLVPRARRASTSLAHHLKPTVRRVYVHVDADEHDEGSTWMSSEEKGASAWCSADGGHGTEAARPTHAAPCPPAPCAPPPPTHPRRHTKNPRQPPAPSARGAGRSRGALRPPRGARAVGRGAASANGNRGRRGR